MKASLPELKFHVSLSDVSVLSKTFAVEVNIASNAALFEPKPVVVPLATTPVTDEVTISVTLASVTDRVPVLVSVPLVSASVSAAESPEPLKTSGVLFPPVIVMVTVSVSLSGVPPSSVT